MGTPVSIQFTQGATVGNVGRALVGVLTTAVIAKDGAKVGGENATYRWTWIDVPTGSSIPIGQITNGSVSQIQFIPDVRGDYHLMVEKYDASGFRTVDRRVFRVTLASGRAIPSFDAEAPALNFGGQLKGWKPDMETWLLYLDSLSAAAAGSGGQMQFNSNASPGLFAGTPNITVAVSGNIVHKGTPEHRETDSLFGDSSGTDTYGYAKPYWKGAQTTSAADTVIATIDVPIALGDVGVSIQLVCTFDHTSGTGMVSRNLVIRRRSGTWTVVNERDTSNTGDTEISASVRFGQPDNHSITVIATGIAGNLDWETSAHVHIVKKGV